MTTAARNPRDLKRPIGEQNIDEIRDELKRPFPTLSLRTMLIILVAMGVMYWGLLGTDARPETLIEGVPNIVDFLSRLMPPEFEFEQDSERVYTLLPFTVRVPEIRLPADRLREAPPADEEQLAALTGTQTIVYLYRAPTQRFYYSPEEAIEQGAITEAEIDELEEVPFILESDQYLHIDRPASDPYILQEGTYFANRHSVPEGYSLVAKRYLVREGEIFLGFPVILEALVVTIQMALIGTLGAVILSIPFGLLAARNISPNPIIYQSTRLLLNANRAVPELIYALIFVAAVGLGPFPGVLALIVGSIGSLGKLYAEAFEQIDPQQVAAVRATGASSMQVFNFAVIPQAFPLMASYSLLLFEGNVRAATILGIVGAGGIGLILQKYYGLFQYQLLMGAVIGIIIFVTIIDRLSDAIRKRII